ncbi:MAG TPA: SWIB/MDM2 domain-containing protein [Chitinophagaceae bacterium]|nr:SWIB/MDM2 domain-containing protein [Chitinophagaceae bacterium]
MAKSAGKAAPKKAAKKIAIKTVVKKAAPKKVAREAVKKVAEKIATKTIAKKAAPKKAIKKAAKRKPNPALLTAHRVTPALAVIVGNKPLSRPKIVQKMWEYIKKNGLQDKDNKRMINADEKLKAVFSKDQVSMFELAKIVSANIV